MKWLLFFLTPFLLLGTPQEDLYRLFGLSESVSQTEILDTARRLWIQQGKERWFFDARFEDLHQKIWPLFEEMEMIDEIKPAKNHYDTVVITGSLLASVERRIGFFSQCGAACDNIVFLTGERPLLDSEKKKLPNLRTEGEMVRWAYQQSNLPKEIPVSFVEAPMRGERRPNSFDTIEAWLKTNPHPGSCLLISSQPYVHYQEAVFSRLLSFPIEAAGPRVVGEPTVALLLDTLGRELFYQYGDIEWLQK